MARGIHGLICFPRRRTFARDGIETPRLTPQQFSIAFAVCASAPEVVAWGDLFALLWGDPEDGGPLWWKTHIRTQTNRANAKIARIGVRLLAGQWTGGYFGGLAAHDLNRARGASDCGAAMGVAAPRYAPGLRPAKRSAQPLTNSGVARHQAHDGRFLPELAGAVRAVPASFGSLQHRHSPPPFHATEPENRRPCPDF